MTGQPLVQASCALGERGEERVPGGQAGAGADGGDVVQVAPRTLELEQDRADTRELCASAASPSDFLARVCVGDELETAHAAHARCA